MTGFRGRASAACSTSIKCLRTATMPGNDLHEGIDRGIRLWDKVLLCASKASLTSW